MYTQIGRAKRAFPGKWDKIKVDSYDTSKKARAVDGFWTEIKKLSEKKFDIDAVTNKEVALLSKFIEMVVLDQSAGQGGLPPDHDQALNLFCENLCKFPFRYVQSYADRQMKSNAHEYCDEWNKFAFLDIAATVNVISKRPAPSLTYEDGYVYYNDALNEKQVFALRLWLPPSAHVKSGFSSILDFPNALNNNFILG